MVTHKKVTSKKAIVPADYVNVKTGELLSTEVSQVTSVNKISEDLIIISNSEYVIVDSQALEYISKILNNSDLANVIKMTNMVRGTYNILHATKNTPHNNESLRIELDYSLNKFRDFLKRLYKLGIISYILSCVGGVDKKYIMLNPNLARKSKTFDKDCLKQFQSFNLILENNK